MTSAATINAPRVGGGRLRSMVHASTVFLAFSNLAFAGGDGGESVVRSNGADLRSDFPREAGKIPVVFVHGLFGSPGNWSAMIDRLSAEPSARARFQFLTFGYDSLQPIPESGRELLEALVHARRRFDPEGHDDSFDRVVLVGHSLGGLIAKAVAAQAADPLPNGLQRADNGPGWHGAPRVGRVIYVATPHRGSPAGQGVIRSVGGLLSRVVSPSIAAPHAGVDREPLRASSSMDQLTWDHPLLGDLERASVAAGVPSHSIIAALFELSAEGATDGLVPVASARLAGTRSELVVTSAHGCLQHPQVIGEVRRVLSEHAAEPLRSPGAGPGGLAARRISQDSFQPADPAGNPGRNLPPTGPLAAEYVPGRRTQSERPARP
jgi:pimeloyl-ACP methyl ester carboxylesterase